MSGLKDHQQALQTWLAQVSSSRKVEITTMKPLTGGSIQENWRIECDVEGGANSGPQRFVLRSDAQSVIAASLSRSEEFQILVAVNEVGVIVPEPLWLCENTEVIGRPFYIMEHVEGIALGPKVVKDQSLGGDRETLGQTLGRELAKIHSIRPPVAELDFLVVPDTHPAINIITSLRQHLDEIDEIRPVLEWGLRWAELNLPAAPEITLVHQDFRSGNYLLDNEGLNGILDWEFAAWGDPMSDLGWFCAECWRFSRPELEAGGISSRRAFYQGYEVGSGISVDKTAVFFWELIAHIRWAVIALQQTNRHQSGLQRSLELALTGRLLPDLELWILNMTSPSAWKTI